MTSELTDLHPIPRTGNGREPTVAVEPRRLLVDVLRDDLGLTGTHVGCEHGVCGTCTVLLDGASVRSCISSMMTSGGCTTLSCRRRASRAGTGMSSPNHLKSKSSSF